MNNSTHGETANANGRQIRKGGTINNTTSMEHYTSNGKKITRGVIKNLLPQEVLNYGDVPKMLKFNHQIFWLCQEDDEYLEEFIENVENHFLDLSKEDKEKDDKHLRWDLIETIDDLINELKHL